MYQNLGYCIYRKVIGYYTGEDAEAGEGSSVGKDLKQRRRRLVEMFTSGSGDFKIEELLEEAEKMG